MNTNWGPPHTPAISLSGIQKLVHQANFTILFPTHSSDEISWPDVEDTLINLNNAWVFLFNVLWILNNHDICIEKIYHILIIDYIVYLNSFWFCLSQARFDRFFPSQFYCYAINSRWNKNVHVHTCLCVFLHVYACFCMFFLVYQGLTWAYRRQFRSKS